MKVRKGSHEEIPLVQGKEQQLCFAGAAVKRYPTPQSRETRDQIASIFWISKKESSRKNIYLSTEELILLNCGVGEDS